MLGNKKDFTHIRHIWDAFGCMVPHGQLLWAERLQKEFIMEMPQIFENVGCNGNKRFMME